MIKKSIVKGDVNRITITIILYLSRVLHKMHIYDIKIIKFFINIWSDSTKMIISVNCFVTEKGIEIFVLFFLEFTSVFRSEQTIKS